MPSLSHVCYQHSTRPLLAYCSVCARPCCRDCCVEMLDDYFCESCKVTVATALYADKVHPNALRVLAIAMLSVFLFGFALGPYALWQTSRATAALEQTPWLRGRWHLRAATVLGVFGTVLGLVTLWIHGLGGGG